MINKAEKVISELVTGGHEYSTSKFAVYRAINMFPDVNKFDEEFVRRHAICYINKQNLSVSTKNKQCYEAIKQTVSDNKIKRVLGGTDKFKTSFWDQEDAINLAIDDSIFPDAQPKGAYHKTKMFLKNEWKHVESFSAIELQKLLTEKYPEDCGSNLFSIQRWGDGIYNFKTKQLLVKPLWKKLDHKTFANIFYQEI
jgi:hypothetical protein